ncbi:MAG: metallophosphoesterase [Thermoclostridium sp.]|nr:metallophosphoesterase [Thermoclostridium sp.]
MRIFAISDLHLALAEDKPMEVFGAGWEDYMRRIRENWQQNVSSDDLVLLPGDISWVTYLNDASPDFQYIETLPGRKIITKGNHDYWWTTKNKMKEYLERENLKSISILQNDACFFGNVVITGSRGWKSPGDDGFTSEDEKIYNRELERLKLSLQQTGSFSGAVITMLHYPPFGSRGKPTGFVDLLNQFHVDICIYGHLHGKKCQNAVEGVLDGVRYHLVSADHLAFQPLMLGEW